jgi:predicted 2-oxoglutarate/Fe(II)-dependent dioxygenase YbiX
MTTPAFPEMPAGAMIVLPEEIVHCVTPYDGTRSRITFAWNINSTQTAGTADDEARGTPKCRD